VNITKSGILMGGQGQTPQIIYTPLYTEAIGFILLRSIAVAFTYIFVFLLIAWYAFKRAQVLE
jgi:hypothetical protein